MPDSAGRVTRFGVFEVDPESGELRKSGRRVPLQEQPFRILARLIEQPGRVVTREELRGELWAADTFVDFDQGLNAAVRRLREALGDTAESPRYIETLPKRGYRFIAPVDGAGPSGDRAPRRTIRLGNLRRVATVSAVALALLVAWLGLSRIRRPSEGTPAQQTIAVLPFKPIVAATRDEALELGVTDTLINQLGRVSGIVVPPLSAVRRFDRLDQDPVAAGKTLGVDTVLEGSFQRSGGVTQFNIRLLDVRDGSTRWADRVSGSSVELFALQNMVAERVASALVANLNLDERRRLTQQGTNRVDAYLAYTRGRYHLWRRTNRDNHRAVELLQEAIALDSGYAQGYAALAEAYAALGGQVGAEPRDVMPKAREMAVRALELDDSLAEAYTSLALVRSLYDYDYRGAEEAHRRSIALRSHSLGDLYWYGHFLRTVGRFEEALAMLRRAHQLDPVSLEVHRGIAHLHYAARRFDDAIAWSQTLLDLDPNYAAGYIVLAWAYEANGMYDEAIAAELKGAQIAGTSPERIAQRRAAYDTAGWKGFWQETRDAVRRQAHLADAPFVFGGPDSVPRLSYQTALIHVRLGDRDEAFRLLEEAYKERSAFLHQLLTHAFWDDLRSDPRFGDLLRRIKLPVPGD